MRIAHLIYPFFFMDNWIISSSHYLSNMAMDFSVYVYLCT